MSSGYPDFEGDKQRLYLTPEWAALEGLEKSFIAFDGAEVAGGTAHLDYVVPAGKTLYITRLSFKSEANDAGKEELNQICSAALINLDTGDYLWWQGGNGGGGLSLSQPESFSAGANVRFAVTNGSGHICAIYLTAIGYEV